MTRVLEVFKGVFHCTNISFSLASPYTAHNTQPYLLGRVVSVVLLPPQLGVHLQLDVLEVHLAVHVLHVLLGDVVRSMLPVLGKERGVLLPVRARKTTS